MLKITEIMHCYQKMFINNFEYLHTLFFVSFRPQLLVLMKMDSDLTPKYPKMVNFASQLKAGE